MSDDEIVASDVPLRYLFLVVRLFFFDSTGDRKDDRWLTRELREWSERGRNKQWERGNGRMGIRQTTEV